MSYTNNRPPFTLLLTTLPGPSRKRMPTVYQYRMIYRNPDPVPGCRIVWEVTGGRSLYQIAVEKRSDGEIRWHCTCPDAVYRGEMHANHVCKHVHGLIDITLHDSPPEPEPIANEMVLQAA